jgi:hypothetical protein
MNRDHDLAHTLLAYFLGMPCSPALRDVAMGVAANDVHWLEEEAVLSLQKFARAMGIDLVLIARKITALSDLGENHVR